VYTDAVSLNQYYGWNRGSFGGFSNLRQVMKMEQAATSQNKPEYQPIAKFFRAWHFLQLTQMFGDIPYSEALKGDDNVSTPVYDKQEDIYLSILNDLKTANGMITANTPNIQGDIVYGGNMQLWKRAINTLSLRVLMSLSIKENDAKFEVKKRFAEIVNGPTEYPILTGNADNAQLKFYSRQSVPGIQNTSYKVMIGTDPTDASTFTQLQLWADGEMNADQLVYEEKVINIPAAQYNQQRYIAFVMLGDDGDRWLIDEVKVVEQCFVPTALTANPSGTYATLGWTSTAANFEVEVIPALSNPLNVGVPVTGTSYVTPTTLTPSTAYKYYVRAVCGEGNYSDWAGPFACKCRIYFSMPKLPAIARLAP
ncbi:MAG: SusD/RagB family nutrient-binding outer membrane lipoprotein, partial [Pedobacter sp.]